MATSSILINTRKKINRRFGLDFPGKKKKRELILGVCTDSSGSVTDEQYIRMLTEVQSCAKNTLKTYLIHADCEIQRVDELNKNSIIKPERHGCGGTAYGPAIKKCVDLGCNAIIYFGDMDCADIPEDPHIPVLWITVGSEVRPGNFGQMIKLD